MRTREAHVMTTSKTSKDSVNWCSVFCDVVDLTHSERTWHEKKIIAFHIIVRYSVFIPSKNKYRIV